MLEVGAQTQDDEEDPGQDQEVQEDPYQEELLVDQPCCFRREPQGPTPKGQGNDEKKQLKASCCSHDDQCLF